LRCEANGGRCPSGFECQEGACWRPGTFVPSDMAMGTGDDGGSDGGSADAGGCVENSTQCAADGITPETCTGGVFVDQTACSGATPKCSAGQCVACVSGDSQYVDAVTIAVCSGNVFQNMACPTATRAASVDTG